MVLQTKKEKILRLLVIYRFLTISQMLKIGIESASYKTIWKHINEMYKRSQPLINRIEYKTIHRLGKVEDVYFLTKYGKDVLVNDYEFDEQNILFPLNPKITTDYMHRKLCVDFQIDLRLATTINNLEMRLFLTYYQKTKVGDKYLATTRISLDGEGHIIPDAIFNLKEKNRERVFLFELHLGESINRICSQVYNHAVVLTKFFVHKKLGIPKNKFFYILIVFESTSAKKRFHKFFKNKEEQYRKIEKYFLVKSLDRQDENLLDGWDTLMGNKGEVVI